MDVAKIRPPDDSGSDSFARFCYQSHIAFLFCLDCALDGSVKSVVLEHIEDIAVQGIDSWRFIQVKTRNANLGPWTLGDLVKQGGAMWSALRSHKALGDLPVTIEIFLEGPVKRGDLIELIGTPEAGNDPKLSAKLRESLKISCEECDALLARLRLKAELPSRDSIISQNIHTLGDHAPHMTQSALRSVYLEVIGRIHGAMAQDPLEPRWVDVVLGRGSVEKDVEDSFNAKRLTRDDLKSLIAPIQGPVRPLLRRLLGSEQGSISPLERKLLAGGAPDPIVKSAKSLRANASVREYQFLSASIADAAPVLEDVRERLRITVEASIAFHQGDEKPAISIWHELVNRLPGQAATLDTNAVFSQDPFLLLGEICQISDLCLVDWGHADA
jgi:hypothetical protein